MDLPGLVVHMGRQFRYVIFRIGESAPQIAEDEIDNPLVVWGQFVLVAHLGGFRDLVGVALGYELGDVHVTPVFPATQKLEPFGREAIGFVEIASSTRRHLIASLIGAATARGADMIPGRFAARFFGVHGVAAVWARLAVPIAGHFCGNRQQDSPRRLLAETPTCANRKLASNKHH
jgi:hypothetical protein